MKAIRFEAMRWERGAAVAVTLLATACAAPTPTGSVYGGAPGQVESGRVETRDAGYGRVTRIEAVSREQPASGAGAVIGAVIGGVLGSQIGGGTGRTAATIAGAAGGAVVGSNVEKGRSGSFTGYDVFVRLDNGESRVITVADLGGLGVGERVRVEGSNIVRL